MSIGRICSRTTHLADPAEAVQAAAARMRRENVGTLVVVDAERRPVGIVTDRDLALQVVARGADPLKTTVREVMTSHPRWVSESTPIEDVVATMRGLGVRRLPVVDVEQHLVGIVSVDDLLELVTEELAGLGRIVGLSRPGTFLPAKEAPLRRRPARQRVPTSGLERSRTDLEC